MINRALLARIRKCLALSTSSNEHEAAAALGKARALMEENGLTDTDLALADIEERAARGSRTQRPPRWEAYLCLAVRRALSVEVFIDGNLDRRYIGRGARPEIASYAFVALYRRLKASRAEYIRTRLRRCGSTGKRLRADAFCEGWSLAVLNKIADLAPRADADPDVTTYLAKQYPGLVEIKPREMAANARRTFDDFASGSAAGSQVDVHIGMGGSKPIEIAS